LILPMTGTTSFNGLQKWEDIIDYHADLRENYHGVDVLVANVGYHHIFAHRQKKE
jgi:short-subunit dehydrogenase